MFKPLRVDLVLTQYGHPDLEKTITLLSLMALAVNSLTDVMIQGKNERQLQVGTSSTSTKVSTVRGSGAAGAGVGGGGTRERSLSKLGSVGRMHFQQVVGIVERKVAWTNDVDFYHILCIHCRSCS